MGALWELPHIVQPKDVGYSQCKADRKTFLHEFKRVLHVNERLPMPVAACLARASVHATSCALHKIACFTRLRASQDCVLYKIACFTRLHA